MGINNLSKTYYLNNFLERVTLKNKRFSSLLTYRYKKSAYVIQQRQCKLIAMNALIKNNTERSPINSVILHCKVLEKQKQAKQKISRRDIIKTRARINEIQTKKNDTKNQ